MHEIELITTITAKELTSSQLEEISPATTPIFNAILDAHSDSRFYAFVLDDKKFFDDLTKEKAVEFSIVYVASADINCGELADTLIERYKLARQAFNIVTSDSDMKELLKTVHRMMVGYNTYFSSSEKDEEKQDEEVKAEEEKEEVKPEQEGISNKEFDRILRDIILPAVFRDIAKKK